MIKALKRKRQLRQYADLPDGKIWRTKDHRSWGNRIQYFDRTDEGHRWCGWLPVPPQPGDLIEHPTSSGLARFKVLEVERERDPDDMFWALTQHYGYLVSEADA